MAKAALAFLLALALAPFSSATADAIYLHREFRGIGQSTPIPLKRYDPDRNLPGTGLWCTDKLYDAPGSLVDFYIDTPRLFETSGQVMIKHKGVVLEGYGASYAIYANARVTLIGPFTTKAGIPALDWLAPDPAVALSGTNIVGVTAHYAVPTFTYQAVLQVGYYRVCTYASAGTDASDVDGLAELGVYAQDLIHQFNIKVH